MQYAIFVHHNPGRGGPVVKLYYLPDLCCGDVTSRPRPAAHGFIKRDDGADRLSLQRCSHGDGAVTPPDGEIQQELASLR